MNQTYSMEQVLDMAIKREEEAYFFYLDLIELVEGKDAKETIEFIANEEKKHRRFLVDYKKGKIKVEALKLATPVDYKIAEYIQPSEPEKKMSDSDVYLIASHREMQSNKFYTELAQMHSSPEVKDLLMKMASEELKHKEKMEYLYSNSAFVQTAGG